MIDYERLLPHVAKPARYTGGEWNQIVKDWSTCDVRMLLAYPELYEIGMSNLGIALLYDIINSRPEYLAERAFSPWVDMEALLERSHTPIFSLESKQPAAAFDIIGFSIGYELKYSNVLTFLNLAHLPIHSKNRTADHPLIIAGGSCSMNPEPLADFIDAFVLGEGEEIIIEIRRTLEANKMTDGVHIRLTLSRGEKITSGMDPRLNQSGPTLIVLAEFKSPVYSKKGLSFVTSSMRRSPPDFLDPRIHHNNLLSSIMAKIEANMAGADSALMLDTHGFIAEAHGSHVFFVRGGPSSGIAARAGSTVGNPEDGGTEERSEADSGAGPGSEVDGVETDRETSPSVRIFTPSTDACPKGITRETVLRLCHENGIAAVVRNISLAEAYNADEMFCTGTMGEIAGITKLDGRTIGTGEVGPVTLQIAELYRAVTASQGFEMVG